MAYENISEDLICAQRTLEVNIEEDYPPVFTITASVIQVLFHAALLVGGGSLNLLVITLISRSKELQTPPFLVALQVVCCDLAIAVIVPVSVIFTSIGGRWVLGWHMCVIAGFLLFLTSLMRTVFIAILSVDRFLSVFAPYSYPRKHKALLSVLSLVTWLVVLSFALLALPGIFD